MLPSMDRLLKRLRRSRIGVSLFVFCSFFLLFLLIGGVLAVLDVPDEFLGTVGIIMFLLLISPIVWLLSGASFKGLIFTAFGSFIGFFYYSFLNLRGNEYSAAVFGLLFGFTILAGIFRGCRFLWGRFQRSHLMRRRRRVGECRSLFCR